MNRLVVNFQSDRAVFLFAFAASIILSAWIGYRESLINPDGICYLLSAQAIGESGIKGIMHLCAQSQWPFYPALIYGFVQFSRLSYPAAAYFLNGIFSLLSVAAFILIVKELGGTRRVLWLAVAVILLSHDFDGVREYIIRDHGFWAFYLISLLLLLRYFKQPKWATALAWNASLLIATLFRIEGAIFLFTLPFVCWFFTSCSLAQRTKSFIALNLLTSVVCLLAAGWLLSHPHETLAKLGRVAEIRYQLEHGLALMIERYQAMKSALAQYVLTSDSDTEAGKILVLVFVGWYFLSVISSLSWIYAGLVVYAWLCGKFKSGNRIILVSYLIVNILVTFGFLTERVFLSKRYLIALSLILMLWVPFALNDLIAKSAHSLRHRMALYLSVLLVLISGAGGIFDFGFSKSYIHTAGDWLAANVPQASALYANDYQLMYYSRHFGSGLYDKLPVYRNIATIAHGEWKKYDYLALRLDKQNNPQISAVLNEITSTPIRLFSNKRGDYVAIYRIPHREKAV